VAALAPAARRAGYWCAAVEAGIATDAALLKAAAALSGIAAAGDVSASADLRDVLPERLARRYEVAPLTMTQTVLELATSNPFDLDAEQTLRFATGRQLRFALASPSRIAVLLDAVYHPERALAGTFVDDESLILEAVVETPPVADVDEAARAAATRPVVQLVDRIVAQGIAARASDIHLEAEESGVIVRFRVDGVLRPAMTLPRSLGLPLVSRIKIMAGMDIADRLRPQGGRARVMMDGARVDLRVSSLPASHGEKVVIRILDPRSAVRSLDDLGLEPGDAASLMRLLDARDGLVLVTGPTGSGKTTTLYAMLRQLADRGLNVITVEDPVEYRVAGMVQVQVNEKAGLTFAAALRSILRQDPDVILIGEIRDSETAGIALQAALTGHLVLATLHTADACGAIARLHDLRTDPAKLATGLRGVIAQRLVRRVCTECAAASDEPLPAVFWDVVPTGAAPVRAHGCTACGGSGYAGRAAVVEMVLATPALERAIAGAAATPALVETARRGGVRSLWGCGIARLLAGDTTPEELLRALEPDEGARLRGLEERAATDADLPMVAEPAYDWDDEPAPPGPRASRPHGRGTMTPAEVGVVDVYVVDPSTTPWRALVLRRGSAARSPGALEAVHGRIHSGERPEDAALRELREETGLVPARLYNVTVHAFYLHQVARVELAVVFCAFASAATPLRLGDEHAGAEWLAIDDAARSYLWPRARQALSEIQQLLGSGDAGPAEDVLRVR